MYKRLFSLLLLVLVTSQAVAQRVESDEERLGYSIGYEFGAELRGYDITLDLPAVFAAIEAAYNGEEPAVEVAEMRERMVALQEKIRQERLAQFEALAEDNQTRANEF